MKRHEPGFFVCLFAFVLFFSGGGERADTKKATYLANQTFPAVWCCLSRLLSLVPNTFGVAEENTKTCQ